MSDTAHIPHETPQLLLEHHLKALRLPTMLREFDRVARQCAAEDLDYPRYLLRMPELELLERERRATERRIRQAKFPITKSLDSFDFLAIPTLNKAMVLDRSARLRTPHRRPARPAHPSCLYPANERRQLQAQSEQAPLTRCQLRYVGG